MQATLDKFCFCRGTSSKRILRMIKLAYLLGIQRGIKIADESLGVTVPSAE